MAKKQFSKGVEYKINDEIIDYPQVRIIGDNIESKVISMDEARLIASNMEMDVIEINSSINPPLIRICEYSKFLYEMKKNAKKNKQTKTQLKEVQLSVNIAKHDLETKAKQAINFLNGGNKVKVVLTMRGRELSRRVESQKSINLFIDIIGDACVVESRREEGNKTIVILKKK
jgi:translation initiation factor IF-3